MTPTPIDTARAIGKSTGARRVVILTICGDEVAWTTYGQTRAECQALARWAASDAAIDVAVMVAEA